MKSFDTVYAQSQNQFNADRRAVIDREKATLVQAIKESFVIDDFRSLSESEQKGYRDMINEMWDVNNGLNEKGRAFIAEGKAPLTKESTPEQIQKYITREIKLHLDAWMPCIIAENTCEGLVSLKNDVDAATGKKTPAKVIKQAVYDVFAKSLISKINKIKF